MKRKAFTLLILVALIGHQVPGQELFRSIAINSDTVISSWITERIVNNDSIIIMEYQKIKYNDIPDIIDERIVYVDLQKSVLAEEIFNYHDQLESILKGESYLMIQRTRNNEDIINHFTEVSDIYIQIHKLNNNYILFLPDFDHLRVISDSAYMFKDDEGLMWYYYHSINKENNTYKIEYRDFQKNICSKEIQYYDKDKKIQVWKEMHIIDGAQSIYYGLYIPLNEAINYPFLNIINTGGLDDVYDKFDNMEFESLF